PREHPLLAPLKPLWTRLRPATEGGGAPSYRHLPGEVDRMLAAVDREPVRRATVGFGPFTFRDRLLLPERRGRMLHHRLEQASATPPPLPRPGADSRGGRAQPRVTARRS